MGLSFSSKSAGDEEVQSGVVVAVRSKNQWDSLWSTHQNSGKLVVVDFSASWCGPCKMIEPAFKKMAVDFKEVVFLKVDVDELPDLARSWKVQAMPTFLLVRNSKEVTRIVGADEDELKSAINKNMHQQEHAVAEVTDSETHN